MNKRQAIMKMITDNPHLSVVELSKRTGLSRTVFYKWKSGIFDNIQIKSVQAVADATKTQITIDGDNIEIIDDINLEKKENDMNVEASYIIDLQKEKIERLEHDLDRHKSTPFQSSVWTSLDFDFECEVKLSFKSFKMGRTILSITNKKIQSEILGYSISELEDLWDIGTHYENNAEHPIDVILHSNTLKEVGEQTKSLPSMFESLKNMMGNHYIPQPITYICKNKSLINAIAYNKVNWKDKKVSSKIKFLLNT